MNLTPLGRPSMDEFEAQRSLISHQLEVLGRGVDKLNDFLGNIRVENARRDSKDESHDAQIAQNTAEIRTLTERIETVRRELNDKLNSIKETLEGKIKSSQETLEGKISPLSEVNTQSKPVIKIVLYVLGTAATFGLGGLAHYAFGGH